MSKNNFNSAVQKNKFIDKVHEKSGNIYYNKLIMKKHIIAVIIGVGLVFVGLLSYQIINQSLCQRINCLHLKDANNYKVKNIYEENEYIYRALYSKDTTLLRAEVKSNFSTEQANQAIQTKIMITKGIFEEATAPYPGEISDVISCGDKYKPVYSTRTQNETDISLFEGFVNDRLVFGACDDDQASYHNTLTMFYCAKQKKFYQIEIIIPQKEYRENKEKNEEILKSLGCK